MQHTERARIVAVSCFFLCPPGNPLQAATCLYSSVCVCPLTGRGVRDSTGEKWASRPHLNWCKYLSVSLLQQQQQQHQQPLRVVVSGASRWFRQHSPPHLSLNPIWTLYQRALPGAFVRQCCRPSWLRCRLDNMKSTCWVHSTVNVRHPTFQHN